MDKPYPLGEWDVEELLREDSTNPVYKPRGKIAQFEATNIKRVVLETEEWKDLKEELEKMRTKQIQELSRKSFE